jgi:hypothetical protein
MEVGPLLLGFYSSRSASKALQTFAPGRNTGVQQIKESDIEHLQTSVFDYP